MTNDEHDGPTHRAWAHFRFSVVGPLLSCPAPRGELRGAIEALAEKSWRHPVNGEWVQFSFVTIERWYYRAKAARADPVGVLRRQVRADLGRCIAISDRLRSELIAQYKAHRRWSYKLHFDNLVILVDEDQSLGRKPSYSTVLRYMKAHGLRKARPRPNAARPGAQAVEAHFDTREIRSYESPYVGGLWHLDFHHARRQILTPGGKWRTPIALGIHDDYSRLCCHLQWYLTEQAEDLVHGLCQAFEKRGLPRQALMDNGSAMVAGEVIEGFQRLSITQDLTLPYSPFQNGKEEVFWSQLEGRLMAMLEGVKDLTPAFLNEASQAWVEMEYNRTKNDETGEKPIDRFVNGTSVLRDCPSSEILRNALRMEKRRSQRLSDGTVMIEGIRFEVPARFRTVGRLVVQYARWDLRNIHVVDERTGALLAPLYPLDRQANADGRRRVIDPVVPDLPEAAPRPGIPPLMRKLLAEYSATGLPPAYIPKSPPGRERTKAVNTKKALSFYGLKWNPFTEDVPVNALLTTARLENFFWRVENLVRDGGFGMVTGEVGMGKSTGMRMLADRLSKMRDVVVGVIQRPQSRIADFYREIGDVFGVNLAPVPSRVISNDSRRALFGNLDSRHGAMSPHCPHVGG